jgi:hypothetical protein
MKTRTHYLTRPQQEARDRAAARKIEPDEVGSEELKDAILQMIVERFGDRKLTWETVEMALNLVGFEVKQAALFATP